MKGCNIHFHQNTIYIICKSRTTFGIWISCLPVFELDRKIDASELGEQVLENLQYSLDQISHDRLKETSEEVLNRLGFNDWEKFDRETVFISLILKEKEIEITPYIPAKDGYGFNPVIQKKLKCDLEVKTIGKLIFDAKLIAEQLNPRKINDMSTLTDALDRIIKWLEIHKPELAHSFQPGLSFDEIQAGEEKIGFKLPADIYELYQWRNGATLDCHFLVFPSMVFLPFDEAIESSMGWNTMVAEDEELYVNEEWYLNEEWCAKSPLFIFINDDIGSCGIPLQIPPNYPEQPVVEWGEGGMPSVYYDSLTAMMLTLAECCETGAYYIDSGGFIIEDVSKSAPIIQKYNSQFYEYDELGRVTAWVETVIIEGEKKEIRTQYDSQYDYNRIATVQRRCLILEIITLLIGLGIPILVAYFVWEKLIQQWWQ
ncbi:SMI1/KNR4 family protein [Roseofilum reptotaenium CS-1145]|uniref:Knr4/Smi1-like domain-containing protein n=1 Tax=Roseofilum reptotaenium AO1-A TaxID=1925591 RepID=A0A1L9QPE2_9CYAN|nr:SMI1/KNR4 family protein [Roseofilum reptotaenium]MDB9519514.1 SMI1/KNR4 family protein [Roseofilum reptotaenium CS-1145]OJJ24519.1 hypothetical protein BI308_16025 [Roseofilum reptotaenium AO1-A]